MLRNSASGLASSGQTDCFKRRARRIRKCTWRHGEVNGGLGMRCTPGHQPPVGRDVGSVADDAAADDYREYEHMLTRTPDLVYHLIDDR